MDTITMLAIIAIVVLCLLWAIVRVRRRVLAEERAWQAELDFLVQDHDRKQRAFAAAGEHERAARFGDLSRVTR